MQGSAKSLDEKKNNGSSKAIRNILLKEAKIKDSMTP